jgi:hypothetical protein
MELDDLRRQWQQPVLAETLPLLDDAALMELLTQGSRSPVAKMRRNAWFEIGTVGVCLVGCVGAMVATGDSYYRFMSAWTALICLLSGFYFRRKFAVLRRLGDASGGALREHMRQQLHHLRGLVRLYFRATMWSVPVSFGLGVLFLGGRIVQKSAGHKLLESLSIMGVVYGGVGVLTYFGLRWFTRWYLQRLYGQHLDRLEANLRELSDESAASTSTASFYI